MRKCPWGRAALFALTGLLPSLPGAAGTPAERGRYLVTTILACGNCHSPRAADGSPLPGRELSGGLAFDTPAFTATAANITPDPDTGIGRWSDEEIARALTEGVRPGHAALGGVPLAAIMPAGFYKALTPADLAAVVAYLRSVPPVRNAVPPPVYKLPAVHARYPDAERRYDETTLRDPVVRGAYLATIGHCMECHTPRVRGVSDYETAMGRGGVEFSPALVQGIGAGFTSSTSSNITSHPVAGIGAWSDGEIRRAIADGVSRDGRRLRPPMAFRYYANMAEDDLDALVAWLRTVPPLP
ncbi:MAG: c-type cytochrome [Alphaproteobacteria bacterium]|nr:c-type cytochrome [Alphaproteobacteria bacterium]